MRFLLVPPSPGMQTAQLGLGDCPRWRRAERVIIDARRRLKSPTAGNHANRKLLMLSLGAAALFAAADASSAQAAPFLIVGNDEKLLWDDKGKPILSPAGKDSVVILDLANPENPKIVANLPLKNSVVGPPVNVAIDPTNSIALVADSVDVTKDGDKLKMGPTTRSMSST